MLCYPHSTTVRLCADCGACKCNRTKKGSGSPVSEAKKVLQKGTIALFNEAKRAGADSTISVPFDHARSVHSILSAPNLFIRQQTPLDVLHAALHCEIWKYPQSASKALLKY